MSTTAMQMVPHNQPNPLDSRELLSACPLCDASYNPMEARVLGEQDDSHLLHIQCRKCSNAILALVLVSSVGVSSVGLVTDLTFDDAVKFREIDEVSADDVLDVHSLLDDDQAFLAALA